MSQPHATALPLGDLTPGDLTVASATHLAAAIRSGATTSREVVESHIDIYRQRAWMNALARDRFDEALAEADEVDRQVSAGRVDPATQPLLGVPISVKELIAVKGMPHTAGMPHRRDYLATEDATAVARLRAAGAIIVGVGNAPGPIFWVETNNAFFGRTSNAYDRRRTAGGSSGGEGAGVGSGAVPVALGSDMGGSIRIPALLNGVFGHLPSPGLVPNTGHYPMLEGGFRRLLWLGPLARRAEDLQLMLRILAGPCANDPVSRQVDLHDPATVAFDGLRVVVARDTTFLPLRRDLADATERAADHLRSQGAVVTEKSFAITRAATALFAAQSLAEADYYAMLRTIIEPVHRDDKGRLVRFPIVSMVPQSILSASEIAPVRWARQLGARRLVDAARRVSEATEEMLDGGVLLAPPFARFAPRHRTTAGQIWLTHPTMIFNVLGLPTTQVPLGLDQRGMPLGVQVATAAGADHRSLAVALELERAFGGWTPPPA